MDFASMVLIASTTMKEILQVVRMVGARAVEKIEVAMEKEILQRAAELPAVELRAAEQQAAEQQAAEQRAAGQLGIAAAPVGLLVLLLPSPVRLLPRRLPPSIRSSIRSCILRLRSPMGSLLVDFAASLSSLNPSRLTPWRRNSTLLAIAERRRSPRSFMWEA